MTREEAINKIRQMSLPKETMEILEALAPELAESEDERMLREIKRYIKEQGDKPTGLPNGTVAISDMIAWLEKQKDLDKMIVVSPEVRDNAITDAYENGKRDSEKQKEQKPAEWSEEDEKDMAHIIRILDDCYVYGTHDLSKTDHENLVNKLKSLRPSWKPSEEQMRALNEIVNILAESPFLHQNDYLFNILNGLREELKKPL